MKDKIVRIVYSHIDNWETAEAIADEIILLLDPVEEEVPLPEEPDGLDLLFQLKASSYIDEGDIMKYPIGTRFYVHNGAWYGRIGGTPDAKTVFVEDTGKTYPLDDNRPVLGVSVASEDE